MPKWIPTANAIKKEIVLAIIAGGVAFYVGKKLRDREEAKKAATL